MMTTGNRLLEASDQLTLMMWVWNVVGIVLTIAAVYFMFKSRWLRKAVTELAKEVRLEKLEIIKEREDVRKILVIIKGWTMVRDSADHLVAAKAEKVAKEAEKVAKEVKEGIDHAAKSIPEKTKELFVEELDKRASLDSHTGLPTVPPSGAHTIPSLPVPPES
jgi:hypothetical protein